VFGGVDGTPVEIDPVGPAFEFNWGVEIGRKPDYCSLGHSTAHRYLRSPSQSGHGQYIADAAGRLEVCFSGECRAARPSGSSWLLDRDSNLCADVRAACVEELKGNATGRLSWCRNVLRERRAIQCP
jgi:hypothetical protein